MSDRMLRATRVVSVIAATVIALASGTNVGYLEVADTKDSNTRHSTPTQHGDLSSPKE